eukprot:6212903-Pleurochrysis_carterae.AAC.2
MINSSRICRQLCRDFSGPGIVLRFCEASSARNVPNLCAGARLRCKHGGPSCASTASCAVAESARSRRRGTGDCAAGTRDASRMIQVKRLRSKRTRRVPRGECRGGRRFWTTVW